MHIGNLLARTRGPAVLFATAVIAVAALAAPASAAPVRSDVETALANLASTGKLSRQDRAAILTDPELAARITDPESVETETSEVPPSDVPASVLQRADADAASAGLLACGAWRDVSVRVRTTVGATAYKFHQYMQWCYDGRSVTRIQLRYHHITENNGFNFFRGLIGNSNGPVPAGEVYSFMQGHLENCVPKFNCFTSSYPWTKIWAGNNGSSRFASGA